MVCVMRDCIVKHYKMTGLDKLRLYFRRSVRGHPRIKLFQCVLVGVAMASRAVGIGHLMQMLL